MSKTQEVWGGVWRIDSLTSQIRRFHPSPLHHWTVGWQDRLQLGAEGVLECIHCDLKMHCCLCYWQRTVWEVWNWVAWVSLGMQLSALVPRRPKIPAESPGLALVGLERSPSWKAGGVLSLLSPGTWLCVRPGGGQIAFSGPGLPSDGLASVSCR